MPRGQYPPLSPLGKQAQILLDAARKHREGETCILAHSQGCVVAALAQAPNVTKTVFLAPQIDNSIENVLAYFRKNPRTHIDISGVSRLARRDGTFTVVPREYWEELERLDIPDLFSAHTHEHPTLVVKAAQDEVVDNAGFDELFRNLETVTLPATHDFTGSAREALVALCQEFFIGA